MSGTTGAGTSGVAHLSGEDAFGIDRAIAALAVELGEPGDPLVIWRAASDDAAMGGSAATQSGDGTAADGAASGASERRQVSLLDEIEQRVGTAPLFGGGTLVVVRQPAGLMRAARSRERVLALVASVPPGNALAFVDLQDGAARRGRGADPLAEAVAAAGGRVRTFPALSGDRMEGWIGTRASELGLTLGPGAARLLAERVGAFVREGDIDRRRQTQLVDAELQKLALYRPSGTATREDVAEVVPEAVPGSMWAFLDAVAARRTGVAAGLAERLLADGSPLPVIISQLHRRLRELVGVREYLASGATAASLVREMRLQPFRAQKLAEQAAVWTLVDLEDALDGLMQLDLTSKGIALDGSAVSVSDERAALALSVWLSASVARAGPTL